MKCINLITKLEKKFVSDNARERGRLAIQQLGWAIFAKINGNHSLADHGQLKQHRDATEKEILNYGITDVWYGKFTKKLYVKLTRPGILIGLCGSNIKYIEDYIKENSVVAISGISIIEDRHPLEKDLLFVCYSCDYARVEWL